MAATAAPASPSPSVSSQSETDGNGAKPRNRLKQRAKGKTLPAVDAFRRTTHRYPPKSWYSDIAQAVGDDDADLVFWHDVCTDENFGNLCSSVLIRVPFLLPV